MPLTECDPQGGARCEHRRALRPDGSLALAHLTAAVLLLTAVATAVPAAAAPAPRLRSLLKEARLVVTGEVTSVTPYDSGRVTVAQFAIERALKATGQKGSKEIAIVELHDGPTRAGLSAGARGVVFLRPATRTSSLAQVLPEGTYYELLPQFGSFISASTPAMAERQASLIARMVAISRGEGMDAATARKMTFDLLASESPILAEEAAPGIVDLGKDPMLRPDEVATLRDALLRATLPDRVRIALIEAVAKAGLRDAAPALQSIDAPPPVAEAAWRALDQLGDAPSESDLVARLADPQPDVRAAAARELLRREGPAAVAKIAPLALSDPDPTVRRAAVDALGQLGKPEALPPLERVFVDSPTDLQQATGRAILAVGGAPAVDAFGRLAFVGPIGSQRYAVLLLMTMTDPQRTVVLERIAKTHSDADIRELIEHGLPQHHH